jgi:hypothetical protein
MSLEVRSVCTLEGGDVPTTARQTADSTAPLRGSAVRLTLGCFDGRSSGRDSVHFDRRKVMEEDVLCMLEARLFHLGRNVRLGETSARRLSIRT